MKKLITALLAALCIFSCSKDDAIMRYYDSWGDIGYANTIYSDNGFTFKIVKYKNEDARIAEGMDRVRFSCKILKKISQTEYEVELLDWNRVLKKNYVSSTSLKGQDDALGHDAIAINSAWISGGYLNLNLSLTFTSGSETVHIINLLYDVDSSDQETLRFQLRHNGFGESYGENGVTSAKDVVLSYALLSVPITDFVPSEGSRNIEIGWDWHISDNEGIHPQTEHRTTTGILYAKN